MLRPSPWRARLRHAVAHVGLLLLAVVAFLLAAEAGTRLLSRIGPSLLVTDPVLGKHYVAGFEGSGFVDEAGREIELRFNREGFRGPDRPRAKPARTRRIAVVGDSMISAMATDEDRTLVRRLEASLREWRPRDGFEVLNFGVSSSSTGQELALYRHLVSAYAPDVVVLSFFVGNDFADNSARLTHAPRIYFDLDAGGALRQVSTPAATGRATRWLNAHSRFYVWQKRAFRVLRGRGRSLGGALPPGLRVFEEPDDPDLAHAWTLLEALLRQFQSDVEADGGRLVLVVVPSAEQVHDDLWTELVARAGRPLDRERPHRRLATMARASGLEWLDLTPAFRVATGGRPSSDADRSLYLLGRYHLSDEGNRLAAEEVLGVLRGQAWD